VILLQLYILVKCLDSRNLTTRLTIWPDMQHDFRVQTDGFFMHDLKRSKLWFKFPWVCDCVDLVACITLCTKYLMLFGANQWHTEPGINKSVLSLIPRLSTWRCPLPSSGASGRYWSIAISRYVAPTAVNRYLPPAPKTQHTSCMWRGCSYRSAGQTDTVR